MHIEAINKNEDMKLKEGEEVYMGGFEGGETENKGRIHYISMEIFYL